MPYCIKLQCFLGACNSACEKMLLLSFLAVYQFVSPKEWRGSRPRQGHTVPPTVLCRIGWRPPPTIHLGWFRLLHMCMKHAELSFWRAFGAEGKCIRWCTRGCWRLVCIQIYTGWSRNSFWVVYRVMKDLCRRISDEKWRSQNHLIYEFDAVTCIELKRRSSQFFSMLFFQGMNRHVATVLSGLWIRTFG